MNYKKLSKVVDATRRHFREGDEVRWWGRRGEVVRCYGQDMYDIRNFDWSSDEWAASVSDAELQRQNPEYNYDYISQTYDK